MTAQEFLRRARGIQTRMEALDERIHRLRAHAERSTTSFTTSLGNGGVHDRYDYITKIDEAEREYDDLNIVYEDVIECIERVGDRQYRHLLCMYYIDEMRWKAIGEQLKVGRTWLHVLHKRALAQVVVPDKYAQCARLNDDR